MTYTVAITGGIGSGKTTVANLFSQYGITLVDADIVARDVVAPGSSALHSIITHFGTQVQFADGSLNRAALREIIFADPQQQAWLNQLLHPLINQTMQQQLAAVTSPYALWVVPLLVENNLCKFAHRVLVVDVSPQTQITRTLLRDQVSEQQIKQILNAQASRSDRLAVADDIIDNDHHGHHATVSNTVAEQHQQNLLHTPHHNNTHAQPVSTANSLSAQVALLHQKYLQLAAHYQLNRHTTAT
ncbi:MAG: dephospho-CoA kinase [Plesiomonas sp.]|uniref:dephospho-CoA kinase n=1 Tax=Plesiomonas sp. TaxID=2486279 RepID=UPI003F322A6E